MPINFLCNTKLQLYTKQLAHCGGTVPLTSLDAFGKQHHVPNTTFCIILQRVQTQAAAMFGFRWPIMEGGKTADQLPVFTTPFAALVNEA